ncbi:TonB C-terminal domain-containing protein [bacterium]|nr:TonB C-terminal domain-containing protein [bacterium]
MNSRLFITLILLLLNTVNVQAYYDSYPQNSYARPTQVVFREYMNDTKEKLNKNWHPPDFLDSCSIKVVFKINKNGKVISKKIAETSGNDIYDESALEAIRLSEPFLSFPQDAEREYITVNYTFETSLFDEDRIGEYLNLAKQNYHTYPQKALEHINIAISRTEGQENSYILYNLRGKIKAKTGNINGANEDFEKAKSLKHIVDIKRVHSLKRIADTKPSAYNYYYLAYAYELTDDKINALNAINKALSITPNNPIYIEYKKHLNNKLEP